jgi:membrane dipeptidase
VRFFIAMNQKNKPPIPIFVDAHEDLAWNMLTFGRDYTLSSQQIRTREKDTNAPIVNGDTMLGWADYQSANVGLIFSTLYAAPIRIKEGDWDTQTYKNQQEAHDLYHKQLDAYAKLVDLHHEQFRSIRSKEDLRKLMEDRSNLTEATTSNEVVLPIGLVTLMEGADAIRHPEELPEWVERGVYLIGPARQSTAYCGGTSEPGPLTKAGFRLLAQMEDCGCSLDLSHMDEKSVWQALDAFSGRVMASHASPEALLSDRRSNRFLSDDIIRALAERDGVMGLVPYNLFLDAAWQRGDEKNLVAIHRFIEQIDYVCQLLGSARFTGIGTDFDGGYGWQSTPRELNSIADMPIILPLLEEKGYSEQDLHLIFGMNWIRFLQEALP